jgi:hypothetical protein
MYLETQEEIAEVAKNIADNVLEFGTVGNEISQATLYIDNNFRLSDLCRLQMIGYVDTYINQKRYR